MPDFRIRPFRVPNEGEPVPPVDPEELKRRWNTKRGDRVASLAAQLQEVDSSAVTHRFRMISSLTTFNHGQLLAPWKHGEELDDAVFRLTATFPLRSLRQEMYKIRGDSTWGFDPNAFVQKLIEETGMSHTWKPVLARIPEDNTGFSYRTTRLGFGNQGPPGPERRAKLDARELLWAVWSKCRADLSRPSGKHEADFMIKAMQYADFAIVNIDLARELVSKMHGGEGRPPLEIVLQLERNAVWLDLECSTCQRLMREHSDDELSSCFEAKEKKGQ